MSNQDMPDRTSVREQLDRLRCSAAFARSNSLFSFLSFIVEETLAQRAGSLKELVVGDTLYARRVPYDPRIDSTVRVEARRLRRKLAEYYSGPGRGDPIVITLPTGSYRPVLAERSNEIVLPCDPFEPDGRLRADLAVMPFRALSPTPSEIRFADGLTDELIFAIEQSSKLRIAPRLSVFQYKDTHYSVAEATEALNVTALLHGTCRCEGDQIRVTVELSDPGGYVTWSSRLQERITDPLLLQEKLARRILDRLPPSSDLDIVGRSRIANEFVI